MIPAAFDYVRAHSADEAFAALQKHGSDARVLAGGQSLIPAMRFRLARPAVLVDINARQGPRLHPARWRADARRDRPATVAVERASWIGDRRMEPAARRLPRRRRSGRAADGARSSAASATTIRQATGRPWRWPRARRCQVRGKGGTRCVPIDDFLVDSFATAVGEGEMAIAVRFPVPDDRTARFVSEGRAQGRRLRDGGGGRAGVARRGRHRFERRASRSRRPGPCAVRVAEAERLLVGTEALGRC